MLRDIHFYGSLAKTVGHEKLSLSVNDVQMLFRSMERVKPGFTQDVAALKDICFVLKDGEKIKSLTADDLSWRFGDYKEVHIAGGEDGAFITAAMFVGTFLAEYAVAAAIVANIVISVAVGAIVSSMTSMPTTNNNEPVDQRKSNLFDGAVNNVSQGGPIPLVYGRFRVGSTTISSDVTTEKMSAANDDTITVAEGSSVSGNVLSNDIRGDTASSVVSFKVASTTTSAGGTYTAPGSLWTLTIASNGNYTITTVDGSGSPTWSPTTIVALYTDNNNNTAKINIQISDVDAVPVYVETYGDGG